MKEDEDERELSYLSSWWNWIKDNIGWIIIISALFVAIIWLIRTNESLVNTTREYVTLTDTVMHQQMMTIRKQDTMLKQRNEYIMIMNKANPTVHL